MFEAWGGWEGTVKDTYANDEENTCEDGGRHGM